MSVANVLQNPLVNGQLDPERVKLAMQQAHLILPGLVIGSEVQCAKAVKEGYLGMSVRNEKSCHEACEHLPYLNLDTFIADDEKLERFANRLATEWLAGKKVYVHCLFGVERAPLAVAYTIRKHILRTRSFEEVYAYVRKMRHVALDRTAWLTQVP